MASALYMAHSSYLGGVIATQEFITGADTLYFSVVTIVTLGYGEIYPTDCLRRVVRWEVLMSVIMIVMVMGLTIGIIVSQIMDTRADQSR